jgi:hypothetical protein
MRYTTLAIVVLIASRLPEAVRAEDRAPPPAELKLLDQMVGTWDEVVTNTATEWTPKAGRSTSVTKKRWSLGSRLIRMEGIWKPDKTEFISFLTYDAATKEYRNWYFDSGGSIPRGIMRGAWDPKTRTMTWTGTDEFGNKSVGKTKIVDKNTHEWTVVVTDPNGKVMLNLRAKNTRRKD